MSSINKNAPITMAGFGERTQIPHTEGDTWDTAWRANGDVYIMNDDGGGWNKCMDTSGNNWHLMLSKLLPGADPENMPTFRGINLEYGDDDYHLGYTYGTGIYDVDGILYLILCYSLQQAEISKFTFERNHLLKSEDDGRTWYFFNGVSFELSYTTKESKCYPGDEQIPHQIPVNWGDCTFPNENWRFVNFVKYGRGGAAPSPDVDDSKNYVYIFAPINIGYYLARIKRSSIPSLDRTKFEYYIGNGEWSPDIEKGEIILVPEDKSSKPGLARNIQYNEILGRYILTSCRGGFWDREDPKDSYLWICEAPSVLGPWTVILEENVDQNKGDSLTWPYLMPKFTSADGKKMWCNFSGDAFRDQYALHLMPVYLSTEPVIKYEAKNAELTGGVIVDSKLDADGYLTNFTRVGAGCVFEIEAGKTGLYILKFSYHTPRRIGKIFDRISWYVNGIKQGKLKLGKSEEFSSLWYDQTALVWFEKGANAIKLLITGWDSAKTFNLKKISFAYLNNNDTMRPRPDVAGNG